MHFLLFSKLLKLQFNGRWKKGFLAQLVTGVVFFDYVMCLSLIMQIDLYRLMLDALGCLDADATSSAN